MRRLLLTLSAVCILAPSALRAEPSLARTELAARIEALARIDTLDESVARPLETARRALAQAGSDDAAGRPAQAARDEALAVAAVSLAEARLRLLRERGLTNAAAQRRKAAADDRARAAHALALEQARARSLTTPSSAP